VFAEPLGCYVIMLLCDSVLQCVTVCCIVLICVAVSVAQGVAVGVALCGNVLQCDISPIVSILKSPFEDLTAASKERKSSCISPAIYVLQCVAVCCIMLQFSGEEESMHQPPRSTRKAFGYHACVCV